MAFYSYHFHLFLLISIMSSLFLMMNLVHAARGPTGFSLELIHRDSLESKNLTQLERMERALNQTEARQQQLTAASKNSSWVSTSNALRAPIYNFDEYLVKIRIGSIDDGGSHNPMEYYLIFDTGSDLLWLQCDGASDKFPGHVPPFPWHRSFSFSAIYCHDDVFCPTGECYDPNDVIPSCKYSVQYGDGAITTGFVATDTIFVDTNDGKSGKIEDFVLGCGMKQLNFGTTMGEKSAGIMGFGGGSRSFINQLKIQKYEYCLPPWTSGPSTLLRFDSDSKIGALGQVVHTTPMYIARGTKYYVTMIGISVDGVQIQYHNREFEVKQDGTGGCIFDSGTPFTRLSSAVFVPLQAYLLQYFTYIHRLNRRNPPPRLSAFEICFDMPSSIQDFPSIVFHFDQGANFKIELSAAFTMFADYFCFKMIRDDSLGLSVLVGSMQQANHRILYNVGTQKLSWADETCVAEP